LPTKIKADKKLSTEEMLEQGIELQFKLLNGEEVLNANGESIRSWFRDGRFIPSVGIFGLFGGDAVAWQKGKEKLMLEKLKESLKAGELKKYTAEVDVKREANNKKLLEARNKKTKASTKSK